MSWNWRLAERPSRWLRAFITDGLFSEGGSLVVEREEDGGWVRGRGGESTENGEGLLAVDVDGWNRHVGDFWLRAGEPDPCWPEKSGVGW